MAHNEEIPHIISIIVLAIDNYCSYYGVDRVVLTCSGEIKYERIRIALLLGCVEEGLCPYKIAKELELAKFTTRKNFTIYAKKLRKQLIENPDVDLLLVLYDVRMTFFRMWDRMAHNDTRLKKRLIPALYRQTREAYVKNGYITTGKRGARYYITPNGKKRYGKRRLH